MHDTLTGLANRALFTARLRDLLVADGGQGKVTLLFIDLDRTRRWSRCTRRSGVAAAGA